MVMVNLGYSLSTVRPAGSSSMLPVSDAKGWLFKVVSSEFKPTNDGTSHFLRFNIEITNQGEHFGATGNYDFNVFHSNPEARRIAGEQLSAFALACGLNINDPNFDSELFTGKNFRGVVISAPWKNKEGQEMPGSRIKHVLAPDGSKPSDHFGKLAPISGSPSVPSFGAPVASVPAAMPPAAPMAPSAPAPGSVPSWAK